MPKKRSHKPNFVENSKNAFAQLVTNVLFDRGGWKQGIIDGQQESWKKVIVSYIIIFGIPYFLLIVFHFLKFCQGYDYIFERLRLFDSLLPPV